MRDECNNTETIKQTCHIYQVGVTANCHSQTLSLSTNGLGKSCLILFVDFPTKFGIRLLKSSFFSEVIDEVLFVGARQISQESRPRKWNGYCECAFIRPYWPQRRMRVHQ